MGLGFTLGAEIELQKQGFVYLGVSGTVADKGPP